MARGEFRSAGLHAVCREVLDLIRRMNRENPLWGAPHFHGEPLKLGVNIRRDERGRIHSLGPGIAATDPSALSRIGPLCYAQQ
jgi:hypothetical protein